MKRAATAAKTHPAVLFLSQVYPPDPTSLGQHLHDAAREMARRGHLVRVFTSARGYSDPAQRYPQAETLDGVAVRRMAWGSLGKASLASRALGGLVFLLQAVLHGLRGPRPALVVASTSPPMAPAAGRLLASMRRAPLALWLMDLNPDQAIVTGAVKPGAVSARLLEWANCSAVRASRELVVLDRFMAARAARWAAAKDEPPVTILPPWPHEDHISPIAHDENPFRVRHGLAGKRVIMYSGNLSPVHPLDTVLAAARELQGVPELLFLFVGEGGQKPALESVVHRDRLDNVRFLPYQPLAELAYSLSAADVHLVAMGDEMVGIVHPCKVYGAMAAARPVLYLGPRESHVGELVDRFAMGWQVAHGDVPKMVEVLREIATAADDTLVERGRRACAALAGELSQQGLVGRLCDVLERGIVEPRGADRRAARASS